MKRSKKSRKCAWCGRVKHRPQCMLAGVMKAIADPDVAPAYREHVVRKLNEARPFGREVEFFTYQMELWLRANAHKGGWANMTSDQLLRRMRDEVKELTVALMKFKAHPTMATHMAVVHEAADVANFALMVADQMANRRWYQGPLP